jgi:hypothetical protein
MINRILFMTGLLLCFAGSASAAEEQAPALEREPRRLYSLSYGTFLPGSDMRSHDFQAGTDVTVGVTWFSVESLSITVRLRRFATDVVCSRYSGSMNATGVELLFTFQDNTAQILPYVGGGLGIYMTNLDFTDRGSSLTEHDLDFGPLTQAGIRVFFTDCISIGGAVKYLYLVSPLSDVMNSFSGAQVPVKSGTSISLEAGVRF